MTTKVPVVQEANRYHAEAHLAIARTESAKLMEYTCASPEYYLLRHSLYRTNAFTAGHAELMKERIGPGEVIRAIGCFTILYSDLEQKHTNAAANRLRFRARDIIEQLGALLRYMPLVALDEP
jgi:hypothetical protein